MHHIPTGVDEAYLPAAPPPRDHKNPVLVYVGEFLPDYAASFFDLFSEVALRLEAEGRHLTIKIIGARIINEPRLGPLVRARGLSSRIHFVDQTPQSDLYRMLVAADAALLIPGSNTHWWTTFAKMIDYLGVGVRVLADVPNPSESRKELELAGLGYFLDGTPEERCAVLLRALKGDRQVTAAELAYRSRYLSGRQVGDFARLFRTILNTQQP